MKHIRISDNGYRPVIVSAIRLSEYASIPAVAFFPSGAGSYAIAVILSLRTL
jgi:hypothetical protein